MSGGKKCNFWPCYSFYVETLCKTTEEICSAYDEGFTRQLFPFQIGNIFFVVWQPLDFCERRLEVEMLFFTT